MTKEKAYEKAQIIDFQGGYTIALVTEIYNDHEAQLEALDRSRREWYQKGYAEAEYECKAKDEEIRRLNNLYADTIKEVGKLDEAYSKVASDFEAQLKDKDERIKELDCRAYHAEGYISDLHNEYPKHKKFLDKKARSIIAMLFWEWKKHKRMCELSKFESYLTVTHLNNATLTKIILDKAYKILKDTK